MEREKEKIKGKIKFCITKKKKKRASLVACHPFPSFRTAQFPELAYTMLRHLKGMQLKNAPSGSIVDQMKTGLK